MESEMFTSARWMVLLLTLTLAACGGSSATTSDAESVKDGILGDTAGDTGRTDTVSGTDTLGAADTVGDLDASLASLVGTSCAPGSDCPQGLECLAYYGFAGPSGPTFHSCEIRCGSGHAPCPDGLTCTEIADGPGQVCR